MLALMPHYKDQGLLKKYPRLERADGRPEDPDAKTFVLRYDKDSAWCAMVRDMIKTAFVPRVDALGYHKLAQDLLNDVELVEQRLADARSTAPIPVNLPEL